MRRRSWPKVIQMKRFVSTVRIVINDSATLGALMLPLAGWPIVLLFFLTDPPKNVGYDREYYGYIAFLMCIGVLLTPFLLWIGIRRINYLKRVIGTGPEVPARVVSNESYREGRTGWRKTYFHVRIRRRNVSFRGTSCERASVQQTGGGR